MVYNEQLHKNINFIVYVEENVFKRKLEKALQEFYGKKRSALAKKKHCNCRHNRLGNGLRYAKMFITFRTSEKHC